PLFFSVFMRSHASSTLFPYTTLFRACLLYIAYGIDSVQRMQGHSSLCIYCVCATHNADSGTPNSIRPLPVMYIARVSVHQGRYLSFGWITDLPPVCLNLLPLPSRHGRGRYYD